MPLGDALPAALPEAGLGARGVWAVAVAVRPQQASGFPGQLVKTQRSGPRPGASDPVGPGWGWCRWAADHALRTPGDDEDISVAITAHPVDRIEGPRGRGLLRWSA